MKVKPRCALIFGQFGAAADPVNLPRLHNRLEAAGFETILVEHMDSKSVYDFLHGYAGFRSIAGSSLGAGAGPVNAGYIREPVGFVGGFQPSDFDPVMHPVNYPLYRDGKVYDTITRAVIVPANVKEALCFRNPSIAITGGLGHAAYLAADPKKTKLETIERLDVHPGDFGEAQDIMFNTITELANA